MSAGNIFYFFHGEIRKYHNCLVKKKVTYLEVCLFIWKNKVNNLLKMNELFDGLHPR